MFLSKETNFDHIDRVGRNINFNYNWQFSLNEGEFVNVDLPHDWSIYFDFNHQSPAQNEAALLDGGFGIYRKIFTLDPSLKNKKVLLYFSGVYMDSKVFINGHYIGAYPNGYMPFYFYIDRYLYTDRPNRIEVHVQHLQPSSRWYSGSGIYRDVTLHVLNETHFLPHRTHLNYDWLTEEMHFRTELSEEASEMIIEISKDKQKFKTFSKKVENKVLACSVHLADLMPWDIENPQLYDFKFLALSNGKIVDKINIRTGFKKMSWDADSGFYLNDRPLLLKGVCMHHDQGALGSRSYPGAIKRQLKILKDMGVNAIRTAHTPFDQTFLNLCDSMGFLVIEEAFDTWYESKKEYDYGRFFEKKAQTPFSKNETWAQWDLQEMVRKSFNHPAIFMWSVGNEIGESNDGSEKAIDTVRNLVKWVKEIDTSRYVTMGQDVYRWAPEGGHEKISAELDVVGLNYAEDSFAQIRKKHPNWKLYGSETSSATRSRGIFALPDSKLKHDNRKERNFQQSDYGNDCVNWGKTAFESWAFDRDQPAYAGQFIWTGFDYLGEPTPWHNQNDTPAKSSYFGIVDTAGFPKSDYYFYQSQWRKDKMIHLIPHWTWNQTKIATFLQTKDGKVPVRVYTNCQHAELFLNGRSLGKKSYQTKNGFFINKEGLPYFEWRVKYEEGLIEAYAWDNEANKLHTSRQTADKAEQIKLKGEKFDKLHYIEVTAVDRNGTLQPWSEELIHFEITGDAEIVGVDNGNPSSLERYQQYKDGSWKRKLFSGKALVIVKEKEQANYFKLEARGKGLQSASYQHGKKQTNFNLKILSKNQSVEEYEVLDITVLVNEKEKSPNWVHWYSESNALEIQNGKLYFKKHGEFSIQAERDGVWSNKITFNVRHREMQKTSEKLVLHYFEKTLLNPPNGIFYQNQKGFIEMEPFLRETDCQIKKREISHIETVYLKNNIQQTPKLPKQIELSLDDGQRLYEDVFWQKIDPKVFSKPGRYTVRGKLKRFNKPIQAIIEVTETYALGRNIAQIWTGSELPMAFAGQSQQGKISALNDASLEQYWCGVDTYVGILFGDKGDLAKHYVNNLRLYGTDISEDLEIFYYIAEKPPLIEDPSSLEKTKHPFKDVGNWQKFVIAQYDKKEDFIHFTLEGRETFAVLIKTSGELKLSEIEIYEAIAQ